MAARIWTDGDLDHAAAMTVSAVRVVRSASDHEMSSSSIPATAGSLGAACDAEDAARRRW
jgi:hypothetical protein